MRYNMNKISSNAKKVLILVVVLVNIATISFAAWWGTPGYEWCLSKGITNMMTQSAMNKKVEQEDFYAILLRYLQYKNVDKNKTVVQSLGNTSNMNAAIVGMMNSINNYITLTELSPDDYRKAITYIEHAEAIAEKQQKLLNRDELKSFYLYVSLAKYKAATLINDANYKKTEIAKYGNVKYASILDYGISPYYGDVTRKEFLVLMFSLLSEQKNVTEEKVITQFYEAGVVEGYQNDLMLEKELTYAEMFKILKQFEIFDFNPEVEEQSQS